MKKVTVVYCGHKPIHVNTIVEEEENDNTRTNRGDVCARWQRHFLNVMNVPSYF